MLIATALESIVAFVLKLIGPIVGVAVGWFWGQWQARTAWNQKKFTNSIVLSLNMVTLYDQPEEGEPVGSLRLRTLFERSLESIYPNRAMANIVKNAGTETKPGDPILRFPKEDAWHILNSVLNQISEQFAEGTLRANMGVDVTKQWYTFCLTFEHEETLQQFKPRILLIERELFKTFPEEGTFELESDFHVTRVETLRKLKKDYKTHPHLFMDIELVV